MLHNVYVKRDYTLGWSEREKIEIEIETGMRSQSSVNLDAVLILAEYLKSLGARVTQADVKKPDNRAPADQGKTQSNRGSAWQLVEKERVNLKEIMEAEESRAPKVKSIIKEALQEETRAEKGATG